MGTVPQVSQCAAKMAGLLGRRWLGGTPRPTSRSFLTVCTISLDGVGVLPSRRVWVPLTRGFGFPHGDFDSPCRASVLPCGGWRPPLYRGLSLGEPNPQPHVLDDVRGDLRKEADRRIQPNVRRNRQGAFQWLPHMDSNHNKQIQNLRCYHYTMRQYGESGAHYITIPLADARGKRYNL